MELEAPQAPPGEARAPRGAQQRRPARQHAPEAPPPQRVRQQPDPYHQVHPALVRPEEPLRAVPSHRQPLLHRDRDAQLYDRGVRQGDRVRARGVCAWGDRHQGLVRGHPEVQVGQED